MGAPNINQMRQIISDAYPGMGWKQRCVNMPTNQVVAVYYNLLKSGKLEKKGMTKSRRKDAKVSMPENYQYTVFDYILGRVTW